MGSVKQDTALGEQTCGSRAHTGLRKSVTQTPALTDPAETAVCLTGRTRQPPHLVLTDLAVHLNQPFPLLPSNSLPDRIQLLLARTPILWPPHVKS